MTTGSSPVPAMPVGQLVANAASVRPEYSAGSSWLLDQPVPKPSPGGSTSVGRRARSSRRSDDGGYLVGAEGFEPPTTCSQSQAHYCALWPFRAFIRAGTRQTRSDHSATAPKSVPQRSGLSR